MNIGQRVCMRWYLINAHTNEQLGTAAGHSECILLTLFIFIEINSVQNEGFNSILVIVLSE